MDFEKLAELAEDKHDDATEKAVAEAKQADLAEQLKQARKHAMQTAFELFRAEDKMPKFGGDKKKSSRIFTKAIPLGELSADLPADKRFGFAKVYLEYARANYNKDPIPENYQPNKEQLKQGITAEDLYERELLKEYGVTVYSGSETGEGLKHLQDSYDRLTSTGANQTYNPAPSIIALDQVLTELHAATIEPPVAPPDAPTVPAPGPTGPVAPNAPEAI